MPYIFFRNKKNDMEYILITTGIILAVFFLYAVYITVMKKMIEDHELKESERAYTDNYVQEWQKIYEAARKQPADLGLKQPSVKSCVEPKHRLPFHKWVGVKKVSAYHCGAGEAIGSAQNEMDRRRINKV